MSDYFTEQLLGIMVCGALGFVAVRMYTNNTLKFILTPAFHLPVLLGGIGVLVMIVLFRAISVWKEAGALQHAGHAHGPECTENHVHGPNCDHDHAYPGGHAHDHSGHSHDLSWVFVTMLILVVPVALFICGLPNGNMAKLAVIAEAKLEGRDAPDEQAAGVDYAALAKDATVLESTTKDDGTKVRLLLTANNLKIRETTAPGKEPKYKLEGGEGSRMRFNDLNDAAFDEAKRKSLEGQTAILEGRFTRIADKEFTLRRPKMTCCVADSVTLKVRIVVPQALSGFADYDWVSVKGQIQFFKVPNQERYIPAIVVADITDVRKGEPENEYEL